MAKLIRDAEDEEEQDEFYKNTYGGFEEEECDQDYVSEEGGEDSFDSDFSLSEEEDDVESEDEKEKKVKKKVKLFKPKPAQKSTISATAAASSAAPKLKVKKPPVKKVVEPIVPIDKYGRMRASTITKGTILAKPAKPPPVRRHPQMRQMRRLTQAELLAEAEITEVKNLASLAQMMLLQEDAKKNARVTKVGYQGPLIKFQSVKMPQYDEDGKEDGYCSRSFLEFTDTKSFPQEYFPSKAKYPKKECVVTGLPAKYKDPLTGLPYATIEAFRYIRQQRKRLKEEQLAAKSERKRKK